MTHRTGQQMRFGRGSLAPWWRTAAAVLTLILAPLLGAEAAAVKHLKPFAPGEPFSMQCQDAAGGWAPMFVCDETGAALEFRFRQDAFVHCSVRPDDSQFKQWLTVLTDGGALTCRAPFSAARQLHVPVAITAWGMADKDHFHMSNSFRFVFHASEVAVIAASVYPVRDAVQTVQPGSMINFQGEVKWFQDRSFVPLSGAHVARVRQWSRPQVCEITVFVVVLWCIVASLVTVIVGLLVYQLWVRPRLQARLLKFA